MSDQHMVLCLGCEAVVDIRNPVCACTKAADAAPLAAANAEIARLREQIRIDDIEHAHALKHLADYGNNDMARIAAELKLTQANATVGRLREALTLILQHVECDGQYCDSDHHAMSLRMAREALAPPAAAKEGT